MIFTQTLKIRSTQPAKISANGKNMKEKITVITEKTNAIEKNGTIIIFTNGETIENILKKYATKDTRIIDEDKVIEIELIKKLGVLSLGLKK